MADHNAATEFTADDFSYYETAGGARHYHLQKPCIIFNGIFDERPLDVSIPKKLYGCPPNNKIGDGNYISIINETIKWLGGGGLKNELLSTYKSCYKAHDEDDYEKGLRLLEEADEKYDEIYTRSADIKIGEDGTVSSLICFVIDESVDGYYWLKITNKQITSLEWCL